MKHKIVLANNNVAINLTEIVDFLNSVSSFFVFEQYKEDIIINGLEIMSDTYSKISIDVDEDVYFFVIFTDKQYYNNYFFEQRDNAIIISLYAWEYLTTLSKNNGAAFLIVYKMALDIDSSFRHSLDDEGKPECIYDFLDDKTGIDSGLRASCICPSCNKRIKNGIITEDDKSAYEDIKSILNHIGNASKWDEDLVSYWKNKNKALTDSQKKKSVFISYSHADAEWLKRVKVHLKPLERNSTIDIWDDTRIQTGDSWKKEIDQALESSQAAILLVSADFLASDFIIENELPPLLKKAQSEGTRIFQVIVSPCCFDETKCISQFQAVNSPSKTLLEMSSGEQERLLVQLAKDIISHAKG